MRDRQRPPVEIHVVDNRVNPKIELKGSAEDILLAWGWLTLAICDHYGISEEKLAQKMPGAVGDLRRALGGQTVINLGAVENCRREKGGRP